jgi:hypothetical protein
VYLHIEILLLLLQVLDIVLVGYFLPAQQN